jgi:hypothetical protein
VGPPLPLPSRLASGGVGSQLWIRGVVGWQRQIWWRPTSGNGQAPDGGLLPHVWRAPAVDTSAGSSTSAWPVLLLQFLCSAHVHGRLQPHERWALAAVSVLARGGLLAVGFGLMRSRLWQWSRRSTVDSAFSDAFGGRPWMVAAQVGACGPDVMELGTGGVNIWRRWCRLWSELVGPALLCSGGEVGSVLATDGIYGMAFGLWFCLPCISGHLDPTTGGLHGDGFVVDESPSYLVQALFWSFSRQIWQTTRWCCDVSLQRWR